MTATNPRSAAVPFLLLLALALFVTGVFFPFFHVTKFWVFHDAVSVVGGIVTLLHEGEYFLFTILSLFTLIFPCVKLGLLTIIWIEREHDLAKVRRLHRWVENAGRWSMRGRSPRPRNHGRCRPSCAYVPVP